MKNLQTMKLRENKNKLHQTDARAYKEALHQVFMDKLAELDVTINPAQNALLIEVPHDELGAIVVEAKFVVKPLDFDILAATDEYEQKLAKERAKQALKENK